MIIIKIVELLYLLIIPFYQTSNIGMCQVRKMLLLNIYHSRNMSNCQI